MLNSMITYFGLSVNKILKKSLVFKIYIYFSFDICYNYVNKKIMEEIYGNSL